MKVSEEKKAEILELVKSVLPGVEWAPEESWFEEGATEKEKRGGGKGEAVHFAFHPFSQTGEPTLTLFLKASLEGQPRNIVKRLELAVEEYWPVPVEVDVRLFKKVDKVKRKVVELGSTRSLLSSNETKQGE